MPRIPTLFAGKRMPKASLRENPGRCGSVNLQRFSDVDLRMTIQSIYEIARTQIKTLTLYKSKILFQS